MLSWLGAKLKACSQFDAAGVREYRRRGLLGRPGIWTHPKGVSVPANVGYAAPNALRNIEPKAS